MNDRFKFRVWSNKENKMYKVHSLHIGTNKAIVTALYGNASITLDDKVLMQSTGLHDKNGKLIYEGDIVKGKDNFNRDRLCEITYSSIYCCFFIVGDKWSDEYLFNLNDKEVIGNIYEDKELLNEI